MNQKIFDAAPGSRYFAPLVGICRQAGVEYLLWEALPGADATLLNYLHTPWYGSLADALGIDCTTNRGTRDAALFRTSLHEMLSALRVVHGEGIVHRDVKPENWLVDRNSRSLRLIDLGSQHLHTHTHAQFHPHNTHPMQGYLCKGVTHFYFSDAHPHRCGLRDGRV